MDRKPLELSIAFDDAIASSAPLIAHKPDVALPSSPDRLGRLPLVPERVLQPLMPESLGRRFAALGAAVMVHGGFLALLILLIGWRVLPDPPEQAIPVEVVASMPQMPVPAPVPIPAPPPPAPASSPDAQGASPKTESAAPPPLAAPPPEPMQAKTQPMAEKPVEATPPTPVPQPQAVAPAPPAEALPVLASPTGGFAVAPPAPPPSSTPGKAGTTPAKPPVDMADVLPMNYSLMPSTFRAMLSGNGAAVDADYKGLVFGRVGRSHHAVERAQALHLRGSMIVSFSVDDQGHATDLKIKASSGTPSLDALGLDMVREAEPFPPPPPGATRTFSTSFAFGAE